MQLFSANATTFSKKKKKKIAPRSMKKPSSKVAHNRPKSHFMFNKNVSLPDFYIMTLAESLRRTLKEALCFSIDSATKTDAFFVTCHTVSN